MPQWHVHRRLLTVLAAGVAGALSAGVVTAFAPTASAAGEPVALSLPAPTGPDRIGTVALHLVDPSRRDPWVPSHPLRELMISIWYPATDTADRPTAPWMLPGAAAHFLAGNGVPVDDVTLPPTVGHVGAPVDRRGGPRPVLLYSPGSHTDRPHDRHRAGRGPGQQGLRRGHH